MNSMLATVGLHPGEDLEWPLGVLGPLLGIASCSLIPGCSLDGLLPIAACVGACGKPENASLGFSPPPWPLTRPPPAGHESCRAPGLKRSKLAPGSPRLFRRLADPADAGRVVLSRPAPRNGEPGEWSCFSACAPTATGLMAPRQNPHPRHPARPAGVARGVQRAHVPTWCSYRRPPARPSPQPSPPSNEQIPLGHVEAGLAAPTTCSILSRREPTAA